MAKFTEADVDECVCFHKQVTEWTRCLHFPHHDLGDAIIRGLGTKDPVTQRAVRAACARRGLSQGSHGGYHGP